MLTSPMRAIDQGIPVAVLGIETQAPPYSLWSKPGLKSIPELRGKTIVVGGAKDLTLAREAAGRCVRSFALLRTTEECSYSAPAPITQSRPWRSRSVRASRQTPPLGVAPIRASWSPCATSS